MECDICGCDCDDSDLIIMGTVEVVMCDDCYEESMSHLDEDEDE